MSAYGVRITTKVSDQRYDLKVKGQGQIYLKMRLTARNMIFSFSFWRRVFIFGTMIGYVVYMTRKFSENRYDIEVKGQCHIYLKSGCMDSYANSPLIRMSRSKYRANNLRHRMDVVNT